MRIARFLMTGGSAIVLGALLAAAPVSTARQSLDLDEVLRKMEQIGARVNSMSCDIVQQKWTHLLKRFDTPETGTFSFMREKEGLVLRRDIKQPGQHSLVIRRGKVVFFQPAIKQAFEHNLGNNKNKAEFLLLGFGADRAAIGETYATKLLGSDTVNGRATYKLELTPRSDDMAAFFPRIVLWIDAQWWIPIQQQLFEPTHDYLLVRFEKVKLNPKLKASSFELKLPKDVTVIKS